jgi:hypothetical protein
MGDLSPRPGRPPSRRSREQRAYRLVLTGGTAAAVAVGGVVLAVVGVLGWWLPILAVIVAAICGLLFRRTVSV